MNNGPITMMLVLLAFLFLDPHLILMVLLPMSFAFNGITLLNLMVLVNVAHALMDLNVLLPGYVPLNLLTLHALNIHVCDSFSPYQLPSIMSLPLPTLRMPSNNLLLLNVNVTFNLMLLTAPGITRNITKRLTLKPMLYLFSSPFKVTRLVAINGRQ